VSRRWWLVLDVGAKALVIGLTALGAFGGFERFAGGTTRTTS
jgi:hypothetical protein